MIKSLNLHIGNAGKFVASHYQVINGHFNINENRFYLMDGVATEELKFKANVEIFYSGFRSVFSYFKMAYLISSSDKVILHGMNDPRVVLVLFLLPFAHKKIYWVIWGGDLYQFTKATNTWSSRTKEALRRFVIRRIGHLVTYIEGDVELARQWYGAKGAYHECIMYLSNVVDLQMTSDTAAISDHDGWNILLGNSADPSNNHIEALKCLLPFKDQDIKIYAPLSYGDQSHAKKVTSLGKKWFGDKFVPMTDFMPLERYMEFLKSLDIAIFNHQRQQAMGNIITLLGMGKTVFMRSNVSHWLFLDGLGIKLIDVENLELCRIAPDEANENIQLICSYFSRTRLIKQLTEVLK